MEPYIGEIRIFAGNFAPRGWAFCNGQLLPLSQNTALFSLLGVMYGGDGKSNFALPNLQHRVPMHYGQGPGLSPHFQGETGGAQTTTLTSANLPAHAHQAVGTNDPANQAAPTEAVPGAAPGGRGQRGPSMYSNASSPAPVDLSPDTVSITGNNQPFSLIQPIVAVNYIIALQGVFPPRN